MIHISKRNYPAQRKQSRYDPAPSFAAAEAMGTIFTLSIASTSSIEEVAAAAPNAIKWFQLYVLKNR